MTTRVLGVDGWKGRWVGIELDDGAFHRAHVFDHLGDALALPGCEVVAVDVPIGFPGDRSGPRPADVEARRLLGARRASVFDVPPRPVVEAEPYAEAAALCRRLTGRGLSRQTYSLRVNILQADALVGAAGDRLVEAHPEVSFATMADAPPRHSKRTWSGTSERVALLAAQGVEIPPDPGPAGVAPADDVLDAAAVAWTAWRRARGVAVTFPDDPPMDDRGRPVAIWA